MTPITMKEVAAFLLGEASLDGYWFGERHPISPFWWREHLRAAQPERNPYHEADSGVYGHEYMGQSAQPQEEPERKPTTDDQWQTSLDEYIKEIYG